MQGRKLTDIINEDHENVKYFPGVKARDFCFLCSRNPSSLSDSMQPSGTHIHRQIRVDCLCLRVRAWVIVCLCHNLSER
jgi:hypothetical protein